MDPYRYTSFNTGVPSGVVYVEGYGLAEVVWFTEDGEVDIDSGGGRTMRVPGSTGWRPRIHP